MLACLSPLRISICFDKVMIEAMATLRITEAELARDVHAVLAKVREDVEVIVEQDHHLAATIKPPQGPGRKISECIALARPVRREARLRADA